jgi:hypothetical protein
MAFPNGNIMLIQTLDFVEQNIENRQFCSNRKNKEINISKIRDHSILICLNDCGSVGF